MRDRFASISRTAELCDAVNAVNLAFDLTDEVFYPQEYYSDTYFSTQYTESDYDDNFI